MARYLGPAANSGPGGPGRLAWAGTGTMQLRRSVVLIGMMGAGKTAVGTALARHLDVPFLDSDEEITRAARMTVAEIFARDGEPFFRARESEVLLRLLNGPPAILSTGGGAYLAAQNRQAISAHGVAVWLKADLELEEEAIPPLREAIVHCEKVRDFVSRDLFAHILENEEEHVDTLETQFELIRQMGIENYIQLQSQPAAD